jgi:hypothetical protein
MRVASHSEQIRDMAFASCDSYVCVTQTALSSVPVGVRPAAVVRKGRFGAHMVP